MYTHTHAYMHTRGETQHAVCARETCKHTRYHRSTVPCTCGQSRAYRDLLDLPCVRDDLLHHLHGLSGAALGLLGLTLGLSLNNLHLLTFSHLHSHGCGLERTVMRKLIQAQLRVIRLTKELTTSS